MQLTIAEELQRAFDLSTLRKEARSLDRGRYWQAVTDVQDRVDDARKREERLFRERYDTRVETTRRRLVDEAAEKGFDLKPRWAADDRFDASATQRQAERMVRLAHEARLRRIEDFEGRELGGVVLRAMREQNLRGVAREEFGRAGERRQGEERRQWLPQDERMTVVAPSRDGRRRNRPREA